MGASAGRPLYPLREEEDISRDQTYKRGPLPPPLPASTVVASAKVFWCDVRRYMYHVIYIIFILIFSIPYYNRDVSQRRQAYISCCVTTIKVIMSGHESRKKYRNGKLHFMMACQKYRQKTGVLR